jgi:hypothetical protein
MVVGRDERYFYPIWMGGDIRRTYPMKPTNCCTSWNDDTWTVRWQTKGQDPCSSWPAGTFTKGTSTCHWIGFKIQGIDPSLSSLHTKGTLHMPMAAAKATAAAVTPRLEELLKRLLLFIPHQTPPPVSRSALAAQSPSSSELQFWCPLMYHPRSMSDYPSYTWRQTHRQEKERDDIGATFLSLIPRRCRIGQNGGERRGREGILDSV